ncbi:hypothetical protein HWV62_16156 [Athelia sp. TMB]|nr:hypothetical protein HWV62_16156 [Athelia sp. TMB]
MNPPRVKRGKAKPKIQSFADKYARTGTFTSMSSTAGSSTAKTTVNNVNLGYDQPLKKSKLDEPTSQVSVAASQSKGPSKEESRSQAASVLMKPFQDAFPQLLDHLIATEVDDHIGSPCSCEKASRIVKCTDCLMSLSTCQACFISAHVHNPTHWAERWNGHFFVRHDISELNNHVISLGHSGARCPKHNDNTRAVKFTLCDRNGIHETKILFCDCIGGGTRADQLMRAEIFPGSMGAPVTGFTFNLLKDSHLQALESKKAAYDFISALRRRTNNADPAKVPNPYPQFLRVARVFNALTMLKRSGQAHEIDKHLPLRPPGSVVVPCFACPEPGFNMSLDDQEIDEEFRHLMTLFITADGHFGLPRKIKIDDPNDVSLIEGRGIFPAEAGYQAYLKHAGISPEKSTCAKLNAVDMQNKLKFRGCSTTGVVAVNCARHNFFRYGSMVDLQLGEKFSNTDYALSQTLYLASCLRWILLTYDINCQYGIKLVERFQRSFPGLVGVADKLILLVGKMHLRGHKEDCQYRFSLNYTDCCARTAGEAIEGSWRESKQAGASTQEMNPGHRHDTLTDFHNDWNFKKVQGLRLSRRHGQILVTKWSSMNREPVLKNKEWQSVYRFRDSIVPGRATVFKNMLADEAYRSSLKDREQTTPVAIFLNQGLKLKEMQWNIRHIRQRHSKHGDPSDLAQLQTLRTTFSGSLKRWRKEQQLIMPLVIDLVVKLKPGDPEDDTLFLPSDFENASEEHSRYQLETLAALELKLWEGAAHDYLESVRQTVKYVVSLVTDKRRIARGQFLNTRAGDIVHQGKEKRRSAVECYRKAREAIVRLGRSMVDDMFPVLHDSDLTMKDTTSSHELGDGQKMDSWIWRHGALGDMPQKERDEFQQQSDSVQWFRARADMYRWLEQKETLESEFRRTIKGFDRMTNIWREMAKENREKKGYEAYGLQKADMYERMAGECRVKFEKTGAGWPAQDQSESDYVRSRRPQLEYEFDTPD